MPRLLLSFAILLLLATTALAQDRETKVRNDKANVTGAGFWIYDDLDQGIKLAKTTGKPLLVVIRCIPCEACEGFDARVVDRDAAINDVMQKFVCVRIVKGNGLDLSLFQYDYDLSFAAFFMNANKTIYGRFGTRTKGADAASEITLDGFRKAMETALAWHKDYPLNKTDFAGKHGAPVKYKVPEELPPLKTRYKSTLDYEGKVVQSCIHCHQIRDSERQMLRDAKQPLPDHVLYPYPMPDVVGLKLDPRELATVKEVLPNSTAKTAGFQNGDKLVSLGGQAMISIADVQWVLHTAPAPTNLAAVVERGGKQVKLTLPLAKNWRTVDDISWRPTSWELRRMATGGLLLETLPAVERADFNLKDDQLALRVKHAGEYGEHAAAKNAGFQKGDILVKFDGSTKALTETEVFALGMNRFKPGDKIPVTIVRAGKTIDLKLPVQ